VTPGRSDTCDNTAVFYFYRRGPESVQCEVRAAADGPGYEIVITNPDGTERYERFGTSEQVHARWLEIHSGFERDGWWGPATQDGRG
jgi:hypothetical protein